MTRHDLVRQLTGWRQTTAEILYRMPDHPTLVQTFLWQDMDRCHDDPQLTYPRLRRFCEWWNATLDGPIVQVRVAGAHVVTAGELRHVGAEVALH
ncbi:MAG TPA: Usg family protein [Rhodopila sp.]|nr:Usg family protein [Rhodopila sp.]